MANGAKKSLYLFLTSLLGVLLFLIIHRVVFFIFVYMVSMGYVVVYMDYLSFLALEYLTLAVWLLLGSWYGIWLGLYWFEKVYEEQSHGGLVHHISTKYFPFSRPKNLEGKMAEVRQQLEQNLWQLEKLAQTEAAAQLIPDPKPIKRRVVRKKAPKKLQ